MRQAALVTLFVSLSASLFAQVGGSGAIQGTVTDPSGSVVPGASVLALNVATGVQTERKTTDSGVYALSPLQPGEYSVTVRAAGFETVIQQHVVVDALASVGLNVRLAIGSTAQEMTVEAAPSELKTDDATLGQSMENKVYAALPLSMNGVPRDPTQFVNLVPGVNSGATQVAGTSFASFNGGQTYQNEVYLEGIPLTNAAAQGETRNLSMGVSVEAVEQFQVETSVSKAMYEGQGVENYVLKSGTNQLHGSAYHYFRNTDLDARGFFPATTPIEHQNEFGANAAGPIRRNKAFFFGSYDGYRFASASIPNLQSVPTLAERSGDFSAFPALIYDPATTVCPASGVCTRQAFPGNIVPATRISPISKSLASYLPDPQNGGIQNNYLASLPQRVGVNNTTSKVDVNLSEKNRFFGLFSRGKYATNFTGSLANGTDALPLPYTQARIVEELTTTSQVHDVYVISPSVVNQFSYSFNRLFVPILSATAGGMYPVKAGLKGLPAGQASDSFPDVNFGGTNAPISWAGTNAHAFDEAINTYVLQNNVQWTKGKHLMTFGAQVQWLQDNYTSPDTGTLAAFTFSNNETAGFGSTGSLVSTSGNSYASYLLGAVDSSSVTQNSVATLGARYKDYAAYIQDDWKITSRLTLNLGLRYDVFAPFHEVADRMSFFNPLEPNPAAGGHLGALEFSGSGPDSCNCHIPIRTHYLNLGPRIGAAYRLNEKTVIRSGYAITYVHAGGVSGRANARFGLGQLGYNTNASFSSPGNGLPAYTWDNGYPAYQQPPFFDPTYGTGFITSNPTGAQGMTYGDPKIGAKPPYYENWNFGVQRSLTPSMTLSVSYAASAGHFLPGAGVASLANVAPLKYLALGSLLTSTANPTTIAQAQKQFPEIGLPFPNFVGTIGQMLRPFPQYGAIGDPWGDVGNSTYNALQVSFTRRYARGFTFTLGYTWSKELDDLATDRNPYDNSLEKAPGSIDRAHVFTSTFVYDLPFGAGHAWGGGRVVRTVVGGWRLSGLTTYSSGAPLSFTGSGCTTGGILGTCIVSYNPNFTGSVGINGSYGSGNVLGAVTTPYFDKTAFVDPAAFTVGNAPRTAPFGLYAPHLFNQDFSLRREFAIAERVRLAFQADAFNIWNQVYFAAPNTNIDSASFGRVSSQNNSPRKIQLNARITF